MSCYAIIQNKSENIQKTSPEKNTEKIQKESEKYDGCRFAKKRHKKYGKDAKDFIGGLRSKATSKNLKTHREDIMWFHGVERHKKTGRAHDGETCRSFFCEQIDTARRMCIFYE